MSSAMETKIPLLILQFQLQTKNIWKKIDYWKLVIKAFCFINKELLLLIIIHQSNYL